MRLRIFALLVPLLVLGVIGGHIAANLVAGPPSGQSEWFATGGPGDATLSSLALVAILAALAAGVVSTTGAPGRALSRLPFAVLPPAFFALLESGEALAAHQSLLTHVLTAPAFLAGLGFQAPIAAACFVVASLFLRAGAAMRTSLARAVQPDLDVLLMAGSPRPLRAAWSPHGGAPDACRGRGPPLRLALDGA